MLALIFSHLEEQLEFLGLFIDQILVSEGSLAKS